MDGQNQNDVLQMVLQECKSNFVWCMACEKIPFLRPVRLNDSSYHMYQQNLIRKKLYFM